MRVIPVSESVIQVFLCEIENKFSYPSIKPLELVLPVRVIVQWPCDDVVLGGPDGIATFIGDFDPIPEGVGDMVGSPAFNQILEAGFVRIGILGVGKAWVVIARAIDRRTCVSINILLETNYFFKTPPRPNAGNGKLHGAKE